MNEVGADDDSENVTATSETGQAFVTYNSRINFLIPGQRPNGPTTSVVCFHLSLFLSLSFVQTNDDTRNYSGASPTNK